MQEPQNLAGSFSGGPGPAFCWRLGQPEFGAVPGQVGHCLCPELSEDPLASLKNGYCPNKQEEANTVAEWLVPCCW